MTKLDDEIKEALFDPKKAGKGKLTISGKKPALQRLKKHLEREHPSTKGKMKVNDPVPKRCVPGICKALEAKGLECDTHDIAAEIDSTVSCDQNKREILAKFGARKTDKYAEYARQAKQHYGGQGKLAVARPDVRAAAFARMREAGELRGYDPKFFGDTVQKRTEKEQKAKAQQGKKLRGQQTLTSAVSTSRRLSEFGFDPKVKKPSGWFDAMVRGIKRSSDVRNPWAIVKRIWEGLSPEKKKDILRREASGERFNYDLPLPDDRDTKGVGTLRMVKPFKLAEAQVNVSAKDMQAVKKSGIFKPMAREDGSTCMVARCKSRTPVNIFVDEMR